MNQMSSIASADPTKEMSQQKCAESVKEPSAPEMTPVPVLSPLPPLPAAGLLSRATLLSYPVPAMLTTSQLFTA